MMKPSKAMFLGSKAFGLSILKSAYASTQHLQWRVLCPVDAQDERTNFDEFSKFCRENSLDILAVPTVSELKKAAFGFKPDVMIVCGFYRILPIELIDLVPMGVWGIHNSLLPKYRGGSPLVWQIISGEDKLGSTFFRFSEGMDDGDVLHQVSVPMTDQTTIGSATIALEAEWEKSLPGKWKGLLEGTVIARQQPMEGATYCAQRKQEDGLIDWSKSASYIDRFIRAQSAPYPGAFFKFEDQNVTVLEHRKLDIVMHGTPGQVFSRVGGKVTVCCGETGAVELIRVSCDGVDLKAGEIIPSITTRL